MSSKWRKTTWGEIASLEYGKAIRDYQNAVGNYPVYGTNGPIGWHDVALCKTPGVVIGRKGAYRGVHYSRSPFFVIDTAFYLKPKVEMDMRWAYYSLLTCDINGMDSGSAIPSTSRDEFYKLPVAVPCYGEQQQIAQCLALFDDRITLLRETNATLEAIAQALFKSWFVDFDPVRAKMEGRAPEGIDEDTAALFPDGFEESVLGLVPTGWKICTFRDTIVVIGGGTPKTSVPGFWGGEIPWFSVVDAPEVSDVFVVDTEKHITEAGLNGSSTKLLPAGTTIISARGTVGRLALTGRPMAMNQSCYGLRGRAGDKFFTYFSTTRLVERLKQRAHGSVFDTITQETFAGISLSYPSQEVVFAFEDAVRPLLDRIKENLLEAQTLRTLRDTLLPRLISGQLRLPEAMEALEAA